MFFNTPRIIKTKKNIISILHLPLIERILHSHARRTIIVIIGGVALMVCGTLTCNYREQIGNYINIPHLFIETVGCFIHAVGAIPALRYFEPIWILFFGEIE